MLDIRRYNNKLMGTLDELMKDRQEKCFHGHGSLYNAEVVGGQKGGMFSELISERY